MDRRGTILARDRESNVVATDIAGKRIVTTIAPSVQLSFGTIETRVTDVVVIEMPELLRRLGVVAIWSPQSSVPPGKLFRFEFRRGTLELDDASRLPRSRVASCVDARFASAALIVDAVIGGHAARVELDTGSNDTAILASSAAGAALSSGRSGRPTTSHGAAGSIATRELPPQLIEIDGYARPFPLSIIDDDASATERDVACLSDGVLGLPLLEDCQLDVTSTHFSLSCLHTARAH
jgi:hypothetical protein